MPDEVRVEAARRYIASYELVTGKTFVPDTARAGRRASPRRWGRSADRDRLILPGRAALSAARQASALAKVRAVAPGVHAVDARWVHLVVDRARR